MVPPSRRMPVTSLGVSCRVRDGSRSPSKLSSSPITSTPALTAALTTARMTAFRPGASPPPVKTPIRATEDIGSDYTIRSCTTLELCYTAPAARRGSPALVTKTNNRRYAKSGLSVRKGLYPMKWIKTTGLVTVALSMLAASAGTAEAQYTPTLTATVNGSTVTIAWTPIAGAQGYTILAGTNPTSANIATVNLPASVTGGVLNAPNGTYYLRVRAYGSGLAGPLSNLATVVVGAAACATPPAAPVVTPTVAGPSATLSWPAVGGALGYRIQFSRSPGTTELQRDVTAATTSFTQYIPMLGTFYARVIAGSACGLTPSAEVAFTVTSLAGAGPRRQTQRRGRCFRCPATAIAWRSVWRRSTRATWHELARAARISIALSTSYANAIRAGG